MAINVFNISRDLDRLSQLFVVTRKGGCDCLVEHNFVPLKMLCLLSPHTFFVPVACICCFLLHAINFFAAISLVKNYVQLPYLHILPKA